MIPTDNNTKTILPTTDSFISRHLGPRENKDIPKMLEIINKANNINVKTLDELTNVIIPNNIVSKKTLNIKDKTEYEALKELKEISERNKIYKSYIGMGYYNSITPTVILRNVIENPSWYTPYTPYQAEIAQGRLEAMLNFQTLCSELTKLPVSTCSLLDEGTAAAEAMAMCAVHTNRQRKLKNVFIVSDKLHPQTIEVIKTRAKHFNVKIEVTDINKVDFKRKDINGIMVQYPDTYGVIDNNIENIISDAKKNNIKVCMATDLMALVKLKAPGDMGVDIAFGNAGRMGMPIAYGGPHAAFLSVSKKYMRNMPGRIIGISKDAKGKPALRMALQTREQHIRRQKASSNICTASALMADIAGFYAIYHGPEGLKKIANKINKAAKIFGESMKEFEYKIEENYFDTVKVQLPSRSDVDNIIEKALKNKINLRKIDNRHISVSFDETINDEDLLQLLTIFAPEDVLVTKEFMQKINKKTENKQTIKESLLRKDKILQQEVFNKYHSEHEMLRYLYKLEIKDIGLNYHMIPLGSCTMKLNSTSEMIPLTWEKFSSLHPFVPKDQAEGYNIMIEQMSKWLCDITGFKGCSFQPLSGASGEYAGLLTIKNYLRENGMENRKVILIPESAHGTNPASCSMAGFNLVIVKCDKGGNIDVEDLRKKAEANKDKLAGFMITYPSTHGVYEKRVKECIDIIHENGGLVYWDGANMNALVAITKPGELGADVCHLNLHKTFAMPHGGGGPGLGPICCNEKLKPYLPNHSIISTNESKQGAVSSTPFGSPNLIPISWMYIRMLGKDGLKKATQGAVLNANYMASRLKDYYPIVYTEGGFVAHEFILDCRQFKKYGIEAEDIAKRLNDYGFHAPTMSFPVPNTLMVEPTESESKEELDQLCDAFIKIRGEIQDVIDGKLDPIDNPLKNAPHTAEEVTSDKWNHKYSRELAAYPSEYTKKEKYWVPVKRVDNSYGDTHLITTVN